MRSEREETRGMKPIAGLNQGGAIFIASMNFGAIGQTPDPRWVEIYRLAYERTVEALRPTRYDRAMVAMAN